MKTHIERQPRSGWLHRLVRNILCKCGWHSWKVVNQDERSILNGLTPSHQIQVCRCCERVEEWGLCLYGDTLMETWPDLSDWAAKEGHSQEMAMYLRAFLNVPNSAMSDGGQAR